MNENNYDVISIDISKTYDACKILNYFIANNENKKFIIEETETNENLNILFLKEIDNKTNKIRYFSFNIENCIDQETIDDLNEYLIDLNIIENESLITRFIKAYNLYGRLHSMVSLISFLDKFYIKNIYEDHVNSNKLSFLRSQLEVLTEIIIKSSKNMVIIFKDFNLDIITNLINYYENFKNYIEIYYNYRNKDTNYGFILLTELISIYFTIFSLIVDVLFTKGLLDNKDNLIEIKKMVLSDKNNAFALFDLDNDIKKRIIELLIGFFRIYNFFKFNNSLGNENNILNDDFADLFYILGGIFNKYASDYSSEYNIEIDCDLTSKKFDSLDKDLYLYLKPTSPYYSSTFKLSYDNIENHVDKMTQAYPFSDLTNNFTVNFKYNAMILSELKNINKINDKKSYIMALITNCISCLYIPKRTKISSVIFSELSFYSALSSFVIYEYENNGSKNIKFLNDDLKKLFYILQNYSNCLMFYLYSEWFRNREKIYLTEYNKDKNIVRNEIDLILLNCLSYNHTFNIARGLFTRRTTDNLSFIITKLYNNLFNNTNYEIENNLKSVFEIDVYTNADIFNYNFWMYTFIFKENDKYDYCKVLFDDINNSDERIKNIKDFYSNFQDIVSEDINEIEALSIFENDKFNKMFIKFIVDINSKQTDDYTKAYSNYIIIMGIILRSQKYNEFSYKNNEITVINEREILENDNIRSEEYLSLVDNISTNIDGKKNISSNGKFDFLS